MDVIMNVYYTGPIRNTSQMSQMYSNIEVRVERDIQDLRHDTTKEPHCIM